ncbi:type I-U CRISPR-associated RAMP protein Csb1/Cas7u [Thermodesulfobacteriota bacterium]
MSELYSVFSSSIAEASALRLVVHLKPANADGLVYPPTYEQGQHIFRPAWVEGEKREAVLLDSVQSQANRIEMAILDAHRRKSITYPDIELSIKASTGEESYSVLELSHRIYDAALQMATIDGVLFAQSEVGKAVFSARTQKASALYTHTPITLALGGWDSHSGGGPLVAKLPRLISSEIVGLDAEPVSRGAVKFDPMDIRKEAGPIYDSQDPERRWEIDKTKALGKKEFDPSHKGLGNVPAFSEHGAVITEAVQTSVLSLAALRRLRFERSDDTYDIERDRAGQTAVIALGLYGLLRQMESGYYLRSGCDLFPIKEPKLEVIGRTLENIEVHAITAKDAHEILTKALDDAKSQELKWRKETIIAEADERLVTLVERSRKATDGGE